MPWMTRCFPLYPSDNCPDCGTCGRDGVARFTSTRVDETGAPTKGEGSLRTVILCQSHAEALRAKLGIQAVSPVPPGPDAPPEGSQAAPQAPAGRPPLVFPIPPGADVTSCRSCSESIVWILTRNQKRMPVDAFGPTRGQSHFATCTHAGQHRKTRKAKG